MDNPGQQQQSGSAGGEGVAGAGHLGGFAELAGAAGGSGGGGGAHHAAGGGATFIVQDDDDLDGAMGGGGNYGGGDGGELREQDRFLPIANVARIMKKGIPSSQGKIAKDARECVQECVSEFISFITSEASDRCQAEKRKTINGEDILFAMSTLGFDNYVDPLKSYLQKYREAQKGDKQGVEDYEAIGEDVLSSDLPTLTDPQGNSHVLLYTSNNGTGATGVSSGAGAGVVGHGTNQMQSFSLN